MQEYDGTYDADDRLKVEQEAESCTDGAHDGQVPGEHADDGAAEGEEGELRPS